MPAPKLQVVEMLMLMVRVVEVMHLPKDHLVEETLLPKALPETLMPAVQQPEPTANRKARQTSTNIQQQQVSPIAIVALEERT